MSKQNLTFQGFFQFLTEEKKNPPEKKKRIHQDASNTSKRLRRKCATSTIKVKLNDVIKNPFTDSSADEEDNMSDNGDPLWLPQIPQAESESESSLQYLHESHKNNQILTSGNQRIEDSEDESSIQYPLPSLKKVFKIPETYEDEKDREPRVDDREPYVDEETYVGEREPCVDEREPYVPTGVSGLCKDTNIETKKDKPHYCVFCKIPQLKLQRHLIAKHKNEPRVMPFLNASDKKIKKNELAKLRNSGDYLHNIMVVKEGTGTLVIKRKKKDSQAHLGNFITCPHCFGYFSKKDLWRHQCPADEKKVKGKHLSRQGALLMPIPGATCEEDSELLRKVINGMRSDSIALIVRNDWLLTRYGLCEVKKNGFDCDRHNYIREKLREMGRLLDILRQQTGFKSHGLKDFINPTSFQVIVNATHSLSGYSGAATSNYGIPSLALKLGHSLKACATLLMAYALENEDDVLHKKCEDYLKIHEMKWNEEVSSQALRTLYTKKSRKETKLPLTGDIIKLSKYVSEELKATQQLLCKSESNKVDSNWLRMAKLILVRVILFNRRRQGEVSKMKLQDFMDRGEHRNHDIEETGRNGERNDPFVYTRANSWKTRTHGTCLA